MSGAPLDPAAPRNSQYGVDPKYIVKRGADLEGMTSVLLKDLIPDMAPVIYPNGRGPSVIREETERALAAVDFSKIKPGHKVNILASHHGFTFLGGEPYAEMLRTIKAPIPWMA